MATAPMRPKMRRADPHADHRARRHGRRHRRGVTDDAGRQGHAFGNRIFNILYRSLFGSDFTDIFSGYRAFSRRFVKSFPAVSGGFEIETEMSVHASRLKLPVARSSSTTAAGPKVAFQAFDLQGRRKILWMFAMLMKETRPLRFFGASAGFPGVEPRSHGAGAGRILRTGLVPRMPTWVFRSGCCCLSFLICWPA